MILISSVIEDYFEKFRPATISFESIHMCRILAVIATAPIARAMKVGNGLIISLKNSSPPNTT